MREISREMGGISRTARFLTPTQLVPYEKLAVEYAQLEEQLKEQTSGNLPA